ncbi:MAG: DUF839 domain-containing protein [Acidimicrobiales bacterium]
MARGIDRRRFVLGLTASAVALRAAGMLRSVSAAVMPDDGPYGPLGAPDAHGISLPAGFSSRLLATSGDPVGASGHAWHGAPDGGACVAMADGGWVYVSNSELPDATGGASALRFAADGTVVDAWSVLHGTSRNCAGGLTSAGRWLSCEENGDHGLVWECDPRAPGQGVMRPALGTFNHEAAVEDPVTGAVYLTEDHPEGRLYRFVPDVPGDLGRGALFAASVTGESVAWVPTTDAAPDRQATTTGFAGGEGMWLHGRDVLFTTKIDRRVWRLGLDTGTVSVLYDPTAAPGSSLDAVDNITVHAPSGDVYVCEDGGNMEVGLLSSNGGDTLSVAPFLRIVGHDGSEWCGAAFSPDHTRLYLSSQRGDDGRGRTYEITGPFRTGPATTSTTTSSTSTSTTLAPTTTVEPTTTTSTTTTTVPAGPAPVTAVGFGATWRYHDLGTDLGTTWRTTTYDDTTWRTGPAPLGYGDPVTTTIASGNNPNNRPITAYFRHTFTIDPTNPNPVTDLVLRIRRDDGAVIHLDGTELTRTNMPTGTITATTRALSSINDAAETQIHTITLAGRTLTPGTHLLAVELHQYQPSSSDLSFDLGLTGMRRG